MFSAEKINYENVTIYLSSSKKNILLDSSEPEVVNKNKKFNSIRNKWISVKV